jgi:hypothetical protein
VSISEELSIFDSPERAGSDDPRQATLVKRLERARLSLFIPGPLSLQHDDPPLVLFEVAMGREAE